MLDARLKNSLERVKDGIDLGLMHMPQRVEALARSCYAALLPRSATIYSEQFAMIALRNLLWHDPRGIVIDGGAHRGKYISHFNHIAPDKDVVAIEPVPQLARLLRRRFNARKVQVLRCALGSEAREDNLYIPRSAETLSRVGRPSMRPGLEFQLQRVQVDRLDNLVPEARWRNVALIKLDVEGAEHAALVGARGIIEAARPPIIFEHVAELESNGNTRGAIYNLLSSHGYSIWSLPQWLKGAAPFHEQSFHTCVETCAVTDFIAHTAPPSRPRGRRSF